jgi:trans-2,3-dihydro-3-hydroxyanthranilate isomerase
MRRLQYHTVDVFTDRAFGGNPLAVFTDGSDVPDETMQAIAKELNLSETTFVLPPRDPANQFHVRIFTPGSELPMAGHPTVGTAFVLARLGLIEPTGGRASVRFEEGVGPIPVELEFEQDGTPAMIKMTQLRPKFGPRYEDIATIAQMLSLRPEQIRADAPVEVVTCGVPFLYVPLRDLEAIRRARVRPDIYDRLPEELPKEVFLFTLEVENRGSTVHSRMFAPGLGVTEDPATGAASGPLGCYLVRYGLVEAQGAVTRMVSEQGIEMGRPSFVHIEIERQDDEITTVRVGGRCHYMSEGTLQLE